MDKIDLSEPTSDEVIKALRNAGWLLEQDTAATLSLKGFHVTPGKAFLDPDDRSTSREIDVLGYRRLFQSEELTFEIGARVIIECKQSSMPYVIVGKQASTYELGRKRKEHQLRFENVMTGRTERSNGSWIQHHTPAEEYLGLTSLPGNPYSLGFLGSQITRLERRKTWLADNRGIFTSLVYPLAKALTYFHQQDYNRTYSDSHIPGRWAAITFNYPIVVTSGPLYRVDTSDAMLEALRTPWATVTREIKSNTVSGQFNIDIVTADALERYLDERVNLFCDAVTELAARDPQRFVTHEDDAYPSNSKAT